MPTTEPMKAAVMCRYPLQLNGFDSTATNLYFLAEDIDLLTTADGSPIITSCQAIEIIAVA